MCHHLRTAIEDRLQVFSGLLAEGRGSHAQRLTLVYRIGECLENALLDCSMDSFPDLLQRFEQGIELLKKTDLRILQAHEVDATVPPAEKTSEVFAAAWTVFSCETFDHSVSLIDKRLAANGFDASFFRERRCFDGGAGAGRFSVAMARRGAREVIGIDCSEGLVDFAEKRRQERGLTNLRFEIGDVTDLARWPAASFDFVVSNGVLHHTAFPERGLRDHFRILKPGGCLWLYLYGKDAFFWHIFDVLKAAMRGTPSPNEMVSYLKSEGIREGLIYSFIDKICAPIRLYYSLDDVKRILDGQAYSIETLHGASPVDDTAQLLASRWGRELMGPAGEVRLLLRKSK